VQFRNQECSRARNSDLEPTWVRLIQRSDAHWRIVQNGCLKSANLASDAASVRSSQAGSSPASPSQRFRDEQIHFNPIRATPNAGLTSAPETRTLHRSPNGRIIQQLRWTNHQISIRGVGRHCEVGLAYVKVDGLGSTEDHSGALSRKSLNGIKKGSSG
jgi:hypothetical protein